MDFLDNGGGIGEEASHQEALAAVCAEDASVGEGVEVAAGAVDLRALWNTRRDLSHDEVVLRDVQSGERTALVLSTSLIDAVGHVV